MCQQLVYKLSPAKAVVLDELLVDRQGEKTAIFHYCDGGKQHGARTAKVQYSFRGEAFFVTGHQRVYFNDMRPLGGIKL